MTSCRLLSLPTELRFEMYELVLQPPFRTYVYPFHDPTITYISRCLRDDSICTYDGTLDHSLHLSPALLSTCRQINAEATPLMYQTQFVLQDIPMFNIFILSLGSQLCHLRWAELSLSRRNWRLINMCLANATHLEELMITLNFTKRRYVDAVSARLYVAISPWVSNVKTKSPISLIRLNVPWLRKEGMDADTEAEYRFEDEVLRSVERRIIRALRKKQSKLR